MPKKKEHAGRVITKGRLSRWQTEQRKSRRILIAGCAIVAIVVLLAGYGIYDSTIKPYHKTILTVNDKTFDMDYYIDMLRFYGNMNGITSEVDESAKLSLAQQTLGKIGSQELYRQLAKELDISVTEEELKEEIVLRATPLEEPGEEIEADPPPSYEDVMKEIEDSGLSKTDFREEISAELLMQKTNEFIAERDVPKEMEQVHIRGILIDVSVPDEVETEAENVEITEESAEENIEPEDKEYKDPQEIRDTITTRLEAGEEFSALAVEFSQDPNAMVNEGDLGWFPRDLLSAELVKAFEMDTGILSELLPETSSENNTRYWLIEVLEKEDSRPLEEAHLYSLQNMAIQEWFNEQFEQADIKDDYLDTDDIYWALEKALE
ncbi:MAG: SurA N-terminal domain-containing protein [Chloroflexota bacterium]|nr:SurA N-terminal domain-containing protein [Chloroflexota bacterium]